MRMEFDGVHKGDTVEVYGPDVDGEYRIAINEFGDYGCIYLTRETLEEMHAFIGNLLAREDAA